MMRKNDSCIRSLNLSQKIRTQRANSRKSISSIRIHESVESGVGLAQPVFSLTFLSKKIAPSSFCGDGARWCGAGGVVVRGN